MKLFLKEKDFAYEIENVLRMFLRDVCVVEGEPKKSDAETDYAYLRVSRRQGKIKMLCILNICTEKMYKSIELDARHDVNLELELACLLYDVLCSGFRKWPAWGVITGVRPAKFTAGLLLSGADEHEVRRVLCDRYRVYAPKAKLAIDTAIKGTELARNNAANSYSLYVSIPFCPSRCSYCSFISKTVERDKKLMDVYVDMLCREINRTANIAAELGLKLESVYIGGGTPTVLSEQQLEKLTREMTACLPINKAREFTVEAGRPDTITAGKLDILKRAGVDRISINPQTANEQVLRNIGRSHSAADIEKAFELARNAGIQSINADVIAGLPGDDISSFRDTLEWLFGLDPDNITVHALTLKRASGMNEFGGNPSRDASRMIDHAGDALLDRGYRPYYMYKQKGTVDSLENTGYAKPNTECLYNIYMMDELHSVFACGAGAVTKLVNQKSGLIERVFNYKYPAEYINGFDAVTSRKEKIKEFYENKFRTQETV